MENHECEFAMCPKDGTIAIGIAQVKEKFGYRKNGIYMMVQSWCRKCR